MINILYYAGLDIHKKTCQAIVCIEKGDVVKQGRIPTEKEKIQEFFSEFENINIAIESCNTWEHIYNLDESGKLSRPYLHLAIHGMRDKWNEDIEIGTLHGKTCSPEVKDWFVNEIEKHIKNLQIDRRFSGDPSKSVHRCGDQTSDLNYLGYGTNFNTFQMEISRTLREKHQKELINIFSDIIIRFNEEFK